MTRRLVLRPQANTELVATRDWYEQRRAGLGREFVLAVDALLSRISEQPLSFPRAYKEFRRATLRRFPYAVYFTLIEGAVVVVAVHGRQHPRRWRSRA